MINLKIDGIEILVADNTKLIDAAQMVGVEIPSMCHNNALPHFTSCMVCMVKDAVTGRLIPSCSSIAAEGQQIITKDIEVVAARKMALELLLSEHYGDCEAPCTTACPAHMDIPGMNRALAAGNADGALEIVLQKIALPSILGFICPAPCEGVCRRKPVDRTVNICVLKRFASDNGLVDLNKFRTNRLVGKRVGIVGAGVAGLTAAFYLSLNGAEVHVFEKKSMPGGEITDTDFNGFLPEKAVLRDFNRIVEAGAVFHFNTHITSKEIGSIIETYDAVIIAVGRFCDEMREWPVAVDSDGFVVASDDYFCSGNVFVVGSSVRPTRLAIRIAAQAWQAFHSVSKFLLAEPHSHQSVCFNSSYGKTGADHVLSWKKSDMVSNQVEFKTGFVGNEAKQEALRCLHCDCYKPNNCKLRIYASEYGARQEKQRPLLKNKPHRQCDSENIIFEPVKCIKCGICVRLARKYDVLPGFTFSGRGFDSVITIPFGADLKSAVGDYGKMFAEACPTGAISFL